MDKTGPSATRTMTAALPGFPPGALVSGRYEVLEEIGAGGMGRVYRVLDREIGEEIALKTLRPELAAEPRTVERFQNELKLARRISHRNVCRVYHLGEDAGTFYILMEYVRGRDLRETLRREGKMPAARAVGLAREICEGLAEAHALGVVHRDLKPGNIVIDERGRPRIMDFGIARAPGDPALTETGALVGTPDYISPEQAEGREADARSDLYALGAMLFEMVTGRTVFEGRTPVSVALKHKTEPPPDPRAIDPGLPAELGAVILKCLAKDPADRYPDARALADALASLEPARGTVKARRRPGASIFRRKRVLGLVFAAAAVTALIFLVPAFLPRRTAGIPTIAVLPFENLSADPDEDFFSDGITEDIITHLSKIGELRVISRTSVWKYKGAKTTIRDVGRELNASVILEGSVRRDRDRVRITGQLIDARRDVHLWAGTFDRRLSDVFEVQSEVAARIARELRVRLSPAEKERLARRPTADMAAYAYYSRGRVHYYRYTSEDNDRAVELFLKAVERDPDYALAYAGLADAYVQRNQGIGQSEEWLEEALRMARKALALDPELAEGHKALGLVLDSMGDMEAGLGSYYRAVELNPNYAPVVSNIGAINFQKGRLDEALLWLTRAADLQPDVSRYASLVSLQYLGLELDALAERWAARALRLQPDAVMPRIILAYLDLEAGRTGTARGRLAEVLEQHPDDANALDAAGDAALAAGDLVQAGRHFDRLVSLTSWRGQPGTKLAYVLQKLGERAKASELLERNLEFCLGLADRIVPGHPVPYYLAEILALLGRPAEALDALERALENGYVDRWMKSDPLLETIRGEARFGELMAERGRRIEAMRRRVAELGLDR
jgi:eukaryotic-like serine/threonine-protein kinase